MDAARYSRQILYKHIGEAGQEKLAAARVVLIGCGALGTVLANTLVRGGVGFLRIVDRDFVELNNLQRQVLFDERDAADGTPKAVAAADRLARINADVTVEPVVADVNAGNIESLVDSVHLILDGTDNFEARYLVNDLAVKLGLPWVYGACVGAEGMVMPILPGDTPCLRCVFPEAPPPGVGPTCDTVGVLASIVQIVASLQAVEAVKILTGRLDALNRDLVQIDAWTGEFNRFDMQRAFEAGACRCCGHKIFDYLDGERADRTVTLCGRHAVQVRPSSDSKIDLDAVRARVAATAKSPPRLNRYLLRFEVERYEISLFEDGRAIIKGAADAAEGRSVYAKYIGS
jgi:molybdopterin/thiamine biosynthesis adenylyltransferase